MAIDVKGAVKATSEALGKDADLSYITEELLTKATDPDIEATIRKPNWQQEGNSLTRYADGHWEWWDRCDTKTRYRWNGNLTAQRLVNCANGLVHYNLRG